MTPEEKETIAHLQAIVEKMEAIGCPVAVDPGTVAAVLGLFDGTASDGLMRIWRDDHGMHVESCHDGLTKEVIGPTLVSCIFAMMVGEEFTDHDRGNGR